MSGSREPLEIVFDLAQLDAPVDDVAACQLCFVPENWDDPDHGSDDPSWHKPECPWRRAREFVQRIEGEPA